MEQGNFLTYNIRCIDPSQPQWWKNAEKAKIGDFPWASTSTDYRPDTGAWAAVGGDSLLVRMETSETSLRMETRGFGSVHTDSCMEFFVSPDPASPKYLNYEFNPRGAMHLAIGTSRHDRVKLPVENYRDFFQVKTEIFDTGWNLEFHIPLSFLKWFFNIEFKPAVTMRGNFYKCGDNTARPHYGSWSPINLPAPDFHCPDFFGVLTLV